MDGTKLNKKSLTFKTGRPIINKFPAAIRKANSSVPRKLIKISLKMEVWGGTAVAHIGVKLNWRSRPSWHQVVFVRGLKMDTSNSMNFRELLKLFNLWGVNTLDPNTSMECALWIPCPVSQSAPGSIPVARDLQLRIKLSSIRVKELLSESALVPGSADKTLLESLRESP